LLCLKRVLETVCLECNSRWCLSTVYRPCCGCCWHVSGGQNGPFWSIYVVFEIAGCWWMSRGNWINLTWYQLLVSVSEEGREPLRKCLWWNNFRIKSWMRSRTWAVGWSCKTICRKTTAHIIRECPVLLLMKFCWRMCCYLGVAANSETDRNRKKRTKTQRRGTKRTGRLLESTRRIKREQNPTVKARMVAGDNHTDRDEWHGSEDEWWTLPIAGDSTSSRSIWRLYRDKLIHKQIMN
jgi:hypothetical protein